MTDKDKFVQQLLTAILDIMCVSEEMLKSSSRKAKYVDARKIFSYICSEENISFDIIGGYINRNRTTTYWHSCRFMEEVKFNKPLRETFFKVKQRLETIQNNAKVLS